MTCFKTQNPNKCTQTNAGSCRNHTCTTCMPLPRLARLNGNATWMLLAQGFPYPFILCMVKWISRFYKPGNLTFKPSISTSFYSFLSVSFVPSKFFLAQYAFIPLHLNVCVTTFPTHSTASTLMHISQSFTLAPFTCGLFYVYIIYILVNVNSQYITFYFILFAILYVLYIYPLRVCRSNTPACKHPGSSCCPCSRK